VSGSGGARPPGATCQVLGRLFHMVDSRHLDWGGTYNTRDLGGLPCRTGLTTAWGAIIRSDEPDALTDTGWAALLDHGVRTVIDLRETDEQASLKGRPECLRTVFVPLDDYSQTDFWSSWSGGLDCTPLYYRAFLDTFPDRVAAVVEHIADAPPGGVLIHCSSGRDRTGLVMLILLSLVAVEHAAIVDDYLDSARRLEALWRRLGLGDQNGKIDALVQRHGVTIEQHLRELLASLDAAAVLHDGGLSAEKLATARFRLVALGPGSES
jgi:protein-tyrosine phosphatase